MENNLPPAPPNPPPLQSPPPILVPPPPTRPRKSRGWMVVSLILFLLLALSALLNFSHLIGKLAGGSAHQRGGGPRLDEVVIEDNDSSAKIAVVPVEGIISGQLGDHGGYTMVDVIKAQLDRAAEDKKVKAVLLRVDSPGGEVLASDEIARAITDFQLNSTKPVVVSMGSLAASGGYYVSAPCEWIVANELTITGSIGVIMHGWNYRGLMNKVGLRPEVYKSGKFKDMLSGSREAEEVSPEERAMVQKLIDETYEKFKSVVAEGRQNAREINDDAKPLAPDWASFADGRVLSGKEAYELGFVDQLGNFDDAAAKAEELAGLEEGRRANLIEYRQRNDLAELLGLFAKSEGRGLKVDLGLDLPKLQAGHLYFLSPTFLH
jgi:protease IV